VIEPRERLDLAGLVVLPGGLRKPFAFTRRLLGPRDYEEAKLRIHESIVAEVTYRALGAQAVVLSTRQMASDPMRRCDGLDIQTQALAGWQLRDSITYNVNLWPRRLAIVASRKSFRWLVEPERELLREASRRTLARAPDGLQRQEQDDWDAVPESVNPIFAEPDRSPACASGSSPPTTNCGATRTPRDSTNGSSHWRRVIVDQARARSPARISADGVALIASALVRTWSGRVAPR
jgi:hypothetical protein